MAEPTIKIKRSSVEGKTPSTSNLSLGELGLNTYDGKLFLKQDQGGVGVGTTVITVNPWGVGIGSTAYNTYFTAGNVGIGLTNPTSRLQVQGDVSVSGVVTAVGGFNIGIQSAGLNVTTGVITALNFVGTGNTFNYNSATKTIDISISGSGGGVGAAGTVFSRTVTDFTATEGQTTFNVSYSVGYVDVYINGVYIDSSEYTATNGTSVILNVGANAGDTVSIITYVTGGTLVSGVSDRTKTLVIAGAGQTEFTVDYISDSYLDVYLNGSKLNGNEYTATNGTTVGLTTGASLNDEVEFIAYNPIYSDALWSASNPGYGSTSPIYRVNSDVGIGTTNPTSRLQVEDNVPSGTSNVYINNTGGDAVLYLLNNDQYSAGLGTLADNGSYIELSGKWNSTNTSTNRTFGRIGAFKENNTSANGAGYLALYSRPDGSGLTERLRITSGGNIGIGTTNPQGILDIYNAGPLVRLTDSDDNSYSRLRYNRVANAANLILEVDGDNQNPTTSKISFRVGGVNTTEEKVGITSAFPLTVGLGGTIITATSGGSVGIGTTNPLFRLQINSDTDNCRIRMEGRGMANSDYTMLQVIGYASTQPATSRQAYIGTYKHAGILYPQPFIFLEEQDGGNDYLWMDNSALLRTSPTITNIGLAAGTVIGDQTSDERMKNILGEVPYGLEEIKNINPVRYSMKSEPDRERIGFIAQQVQPIVPESVYDTKDLIEDHEDEPTKLAMEYVALIPVLVNAVKELSAEIESLKSQLESINT